MDMVMSWLQPEVMVALLTLTAMEIVLGIDNVVFISLLVSRLKEHQQKGARQFGLLLAFAIRVVLLFSITWVLSLKNDVFNLADFGLPWNMGFSWKDLILIAGGLFLIVKATQEIHIDIEGSEEEKAGPKGADTLMMAIAQIAAIDFIFSIDSIITAIGMVSAEFVEVMIAAVVISMIVMYLASGTVAHFIKEHPTTKMLALSFLFMIGSALIADGLEFHIPRGYIYSAMAFSAVVEFFNVMARNAREKRRQGVA
jgi:predicted tellurium resistance membrane protein TerC